MSIINTILGTGRKVATAVYPHIPTIAVAAGTVSVGLGTFFACKATLNVDRVFEEHQEMMAHINDVVEKLPEGRLTDKEIRHDKFQCYAMTAGKLFKLYAPAIGLELIGFASIFYGFGMIKKWHALAVSTVAALDKKFGKYRSNVIEEYGAETDKKLAGEVMTTKKAKVREVDPETGETKVVEADVVTFENLVEGNFTYIYDYTNLGWEGNYVLDMNRLHRIPDWYTLQLQRHSMRHVFMNSVLKDYKYEETGVGHFYGWTDRPGCAVNVEITPCLRVFDHDEDSQFPMMIPLDYDNENRRFNDDMDEIEFRDAYLKDEKSVCYILKFKVDTDENGVPHEIYHEVYGDKSKVA